MDSLKPCTATRSAPWRCASLPKLLVSVLADLRPFRSSKDLMVVSSRTISTAADEMYGSEKSYLALRASVMPTWLMTAS